MKLKTNFACLVLLSLLLLVKSDECAQKGLGALVPTIYSVSGFPSTAVAGEPLTFSVVTKEKKHPETVLNVHIVCPEITHPKLITIPANSASTKFKFATTDAGICDVLLIDRCQKVYKGKVSIIHNSGLATFCTIIGWLYFVLWSVSFYPQIVENYKLKDVEGLNFDFVAYNLSGWVCYSIFNVALFWVPVVQKQYFAEHEESSIPVMANDVFFALHALVLTLITAGQCVYYHKKSKNANLSRVSLPAKTFLTLFGIYIVITSIVAGANVISWLQFITYLSFIKLFITLIKYIPQAYHNFKRKSTVGWSIVNVLLDFSGGSLSMLQMILIAYNTNDWISFVGNPTKLGIGLFSVLFDVFFILQHYVLYRGAKDVNYKRLVVEENVDSCEIPTEHNETTSLLA